MKTETATCPVHFTKRERQINQLVLVPLGYKQIAARLNITPNTVKTHVKHIHALMQIHGKDEHIVWLIKHPECLAQEGD